MAKKKPTETKKTNRTGRPVQIYVDDDLWAAMNAFFDDQKFRPTLTDFGVLAFQELLKKEGYWPPKTDDAD